jgi:peptidoglycan/xylan/chitin deacetylase (PgdA/CDA1 family)
MTEPTPRYEGSELTRDFRRYGRQPPAVRWPGGARVAVSLVVNYEAGSENSFARGDEFQEPIGEFALTVNPFGAHVRDLPTESTFEYESRAGIWRVARAIDEFDVKATFFACGMALEENPEVGAYIREAGHEACSHGWRWEELWRLSEAEEREHLSLAIKSITAHCGQRPVGWFSRGSASPRTRALLLEEGGFLYDSDAYNDDLPYFVDVGTKKHLVVPYSFTFNDMRFAFPGFSDPTSFSTYLQMALDDLWEEGATHPKMMSVGLHPRWVGQPGRISALRRFINHALGKGDVWFARRDEIARWWLDHHHEF